MLAITWQVTATEKVRPIKPVCKSSFDMVTVYHMIFLSTKCKSNVRAFKYTYIDYKSHYEGRGTWFDLIKRSYKN